MFRSSPPKKRYGVLGDAVLGATWPRQPSRGPLVCLYFLFCLLLEPAHRLVQFHSAFPASPFLRRLYAAVALLQGLILFAFSAGSRPRIFSATPILMVSGFIFRSCLIEIAAAFLLLLLLALVIAILLKRRSRRTPAAIPSGMELHWRAVWVSLVVFVAACMLNRLDISIRHFLVALALLSSSARTPATHVAVAEPLELARCAHLKLGDHRPRGCFPCHRGLGLSKLLPIPECAQHGTARLHLGE